jgi:hypothetical protein
MKISTLKIFILFLIIQTAHAQTDTVYIDCPGVVGGTWTPENRYIARCDVTVPYDSALIIQPGVKIEFQAGFSFKVEGQLNATGTSNNRIEIKPFDGTWNGISFGTPSGEQYINTSTLSFADIDCGGIAGTNEAVVLGKHRIVSLNNLHIQNAGTAIKIGGFADIDNINWCNLQDVSQGIVFKYCDVVPEVLIQSCSFGNILDKAVIISQNQAFLGNISISGCAFNNSGLTNNQSESAIYITLNNILTSISLVNNEFDSFGLNDNSPACIYIYDNAILNQVTLNQNEILSCGGEEPTSPNADFGGIFINECSKVLFNENTFSGNTGKKSGAGYLDAGRIKFTGNTLLNNRNNYTGNENFAGALTIRAGERVSISGDTFENNMSAKSGGAMYIEAGGAIPLDLHFSGISLISNSASNEGGAVLINTPVDTLSILNSEITGNFSSAGSGGCFSVITSSFNDLIIGENILQDNFVSENSFGGFLFLRHNPAIIPVYGTVSLYDNTCSVTGHNATRNYSLIYSKIKSFPGSISLSGESVTDYYPVNGDLYHFERLLDGPSAPAETADLAINGCTFQGNRCPILMFANDSSVVAAQFSGNVVEGVETAIGSFVTVKCKKASPLLFENETYSQLISGTSGGAISFTALKEIGEVTISGIVSENCFSIEGNGGHFSLVSGSSDPFSSQSITMLGSSFSNAGITQATGGNGGALYLETPGNIDSVLVRSCSFSSLEAGEGGGALYIESKEINKINIEGSEFNDILTHDGDGAVCLYSLNGNIKKLSVLPYDEVNTSFTGCTGQQNGGALSAKASKEIGSILFESIEVSSTAASEGNGGHFALVSQSADAGLSQDLVISNSTFENNTNNLNGGKGGAFYYSSPGSLDSLKVLNTNFTSFRTESDGGALYAEAKEIGKLSIINSLFDGISSLNANGGAFCVQATNGNIGMVENIGSTFQGCNAKLAGGAAFIKASGEIGSVDFDAIISEKCYAISGDGGHFALISGSSNSSTSQQFIISGSEFSNTGITSVTGGNGGAIFYETPARLDSLDLRSSQFSGLGAGGNAGAVCLLVKETDAVNILGSTFSDNSSLEMGGSVFVRAGNGNIGTLRIAPLNGTPTTFTACQAKSDGGAMSVIATAEIGLTMIDALEVENCFSDEGNGGHISLVSLGADPAMIQKFEITGSIFSNAGINNPTGENGGILYYTALSDLSAVSITGSAFSDASAVKDGGSLYISAGKINTFDVSASLFSSSVSQVLSGGAFYVKTLNGLLDGNIATNRFINCTAGEMGGSVYIEDSKFDNQQESLSWTANLFRSEIDQVIPETGGAIYCKGINEISFASDSSISQAAGSQGGFIYTEKVYQSNFDGLYAYGNNSGHGGVIYHKGDAQTSFDQAVRIFNSTFLFNTAETTGGCFYITDVDSVEIGKADYKNNFVANQSLSSQSSDQVGGGVLFIQNAGIVDIIANSFYVNKSESNGGIGLISNITKLMHIGDNKFLSNQAKAGGAFALVNSFAEGVIEWNNFSYNSSSEQGGALLLSPSSTNSITIKDNTFFNNNTAKWGGAIASYRPVNLVRNLFRENHLYDENPNLPHKGTTLYLNGEGNLSMIKNCVFDQNYYKPVEEVASIYYDNLPSDFPPYSISNCSFFNFSDKHFSVFNDADLDTLYIENSIFTIRDNLPAEKEPVIYFNSTVKCLYCDLIYSLVNDTINHIYDEYVYFNVGDYYFDESQFPVDRGDPDPSFNDFHFPPAYDADTNDLGVSGGPDNPDTNGVFIFHEPVKPPNNFQINVTAKDCFTYTFNCVGESVEDYEYFYWFMPDSIYVTQVPELTYTFNNNLTGIVSITALGQDLSNADVYGFGQLNVDLDFIRINGLSTTYPENVISVASVPFSFNIEANIYHELGTPYSWDWTVLSAPGVEYIITEYEGTAIVEIAKITEIPASLTVTYSLEACGRVLDSAIVIHFEVDLALWGKPDVVFYPALTDISDSTSFFTATFNRIMTKDNGDMLANSDIDTYLQLTKPNCPNLGFNKSITYTGTETIFRYDRIDGNTGLPDSLCNGVYTFNLDCSELFTQFYRLSTGDESKEYIVSNNFIDEKQNLLSASVYPNPFHDRITIIFEKEGDYRLEVSDLQGQVQKSSIFKSIRSVNLILEDLPDGIFILHATELRGETHFYMKINKITH